jgi:small multidrug resistance pump
MTLSWINLWIAIAMSLAGQTLLKAGAMTRQASTELLAQFLDPRTVAGLTLYVAAAFLYIIALRRIPLSVRCPARPPLILARYLSVISYTTRQ